MRKGVGGDGEGGVHPASQALSRRRRCWVSERAWERPVREGARGDAEGRIYSAGQARPEEDGVGSLKGVEGVCREGVEFW